MVLYGVNTFDIDSLAVFLNRLYLIVSDDGRRFVVVLLFYVQGKQHQVMSGQSVNLTTLFLGRLRPHKWLTSTSCRDSVGLSGNLVRYPWQPHLEVKTIYYPPFSFVFYMCRTAKCSIFKPAIFYEDFNKMNK